MAWTLLFYALWHRYHIQGQTLEECPRVSHRSKGFCRCRFGLGFWLYFTPGLQVLAHEGAAHVLRGCRVYHRLIPAFYS